MAAAWQFTITDYVMHVTVLKQRRTSKEEVSFM